MKDNDVKNKFLELRAKNISYNKIAEELKVSKQTLITWSKEFEYELRNFRAIQFEEMHEKYRIYSDKRLELFSKLIESIKAELEKRDLSNIPIDNLIDMFFRFSDTLHKETVGSSFAEKGTASTFEDPFNKTTDKYWSG